MSLLLTYDTISGENHGGTLKPLLATQAPRDLILLAKYLTPVLILGSVLLLVLCGTLMLSELAGKGLVSYMGKKELQRLLVCGLLTACYMCVPASLGLACSCLTRRPSSSLTLALCAWCAWVVIVPGISPLVADGIADRGPRSRSMFANISIHGAPTLGERLRDQRHLERSAEWHKLASKRVERGINMVLSPTTLYRDACESASNTGIEFAVWLEEVTYRFQWTAMAAKSGAGSDVVFPSEKEEFDGTGNEAMASGFVSCAAGVLLLHSIMFLAIGYVGFRKYDLCGVEA